MSPKEAVTQFIQKLGVNVTLKIQGKKVDINSDVCIHASKSMLVGNGKRGIVINLIIGHHSILCNDQHENKIRLGYENPLFFEMLENLLQK